MESVDVTSSGQPQPAAGPAVDGEVVPQYEFTEADNAVLSGLAWKMHFVGLFTLGTGVFVIALGVVIHHAATILSGALYAVMGLWTHRASVSFKEITQTSGKDISHLIHALHDLRRLYGVNFWLCVVSLIGAIVTAIVYLGPT